MPNLSKKEEDMTIIVHVGPNLDEVSVSKALYITLCSVSTPGEYIVYTW